MAHLLLNGTSGYITTPDSAPLRITGDLDIRVRAAPNQWGSLQRIFSRRSGADASYELYLDTSARLHLGWSTDGSTPLIDERSGTVPFSDGTAGWVRVTLDVNNGAGGYDVQFYTSSDDTNDASAVSWSTFGGVITGGSTTSINAGTAPLWIGRYQPSAIQFFDGKIYRAQIYDGIDGTLVFDADPSDPTTWNCPDKDSFTEKVNGANVALQGDAELVGDCPGNGNRMGGSGAIRRKGGARH